MDDLYGILSPLQVDQLGALRAQRQRLIGLIADITAATHQLRLLDPSEFWSSHAQRAYLARVGEMVLGLQGVLDYLTEADNWMWLSICQLQALEDQ